MTHPVVDLVIRGLDKGKKGTLVLHPENVSHLKSTLLSIPNRADAETALRELVRLAWVVEAKRQGKEAARVLLQAVSEVAHALASRPTRPSQPVLQPMRVAAMVPMVLR